MDGIQQKLGCGVALFLFLNGYFKTSAARSMHCFLFVTQKQHDLYYSSDCSKEIKCKLRILLSFAACPGLALSAHTKHALGNKAASVLVTWALANHRSFQFNTGPVK